MSMFCYQCQEASKGIGCSTKGVCGKTELEANLQDLLIYTSKGVAMAFALVDKDQEMEDRAVQYVVRSLFITITNANFDKEAIMRQIEGGLRLRDEMLVLAKAQGKTVPERDLLTWDAKDHHDLSLKSRQPEVGVLATEQEDIRSLIELIVYGLKGMAAYMEHAHHLGEVDEALNTFILQALVTITEESLVVEDLISLTMETGSHCVRAMKLLDGANTKTYGHPELTEVNIGVRSNPGILISGHDLKDLAMLLEQAEGSGVDIYTHGEMLPAQSYPAFKKYKCFAGNYGNAWWQQKEEFETFHGPILFTTNCIVPPRKEHMDRIYTTGASGYPGCIHIEEDELGHKDFSQILEQAKGLMAPESIEEGTILGGFAHAQVEAVMDQVVEAVKSGSIKKFFVMAGCDGRHKSRDYYRDFAQALPQDTVILTAGCAKFRYNKLKLGDIGGIPRVLDAGQCNDSYSLVATAMKLQEIFELDDINDLPIVYNIAWYEQKAVAVLLALLSLGVKNIHLGPTLPAFLSPNVAKVLVDTFGIAGIGSVEDDLALFLS